MQLDTSNKPMVAAALEIATRHHDGISRKYCGEPYINHPVRVTEKLLGYGFVGEEILSAALLHDCLEDKNKNGFTLPDTIISNGCSLRVLRWVQLLSNTEKGNRAARKAAAAKRIAGAPMQVQAIKLCDIMDNCKGVAKQDVGFAEIYIAEKQALLKGLPPATDSLLLQIKADCESVLSEEMNQVALWHLEHGRGEQAKIVARDETIAIILAEQERSVFAEAAMF